MNILITGRPGVGKTTLIKEVAAGLSEKTAGFYYWCVRSFGWIWWGRR